MFPLLREIFNIDLDMPSLPCAVVRSMMPGDTLFDFSPVDAMLQGQSHIIRKQLEYPELIQKYYQPENEDVADILARLGDADLIKLVHSKSRRMIVLILDSLAFYGQLDLLVYFYERFGVHCSLKGANWAVHANNHKVLEYLTTILPTTPSEGEGQYALINNAWYMHQRDRRVYRYFKSQYGQI